MLFKKKNQTVLFPGNVLHRRDSDPQPGGGGRVHLVREPREPSSTQHILYNGSINGNNLLANHIIFKYKKV